MQPGNFLSSKFKWTPVAKNSKLEIVNRRGWAVSVLVTNSRGKLGGIALLAVGSMLSQQSLAYTAQEREPRNRYRRLQQETGFKNC
jgi:hypothetical protein